MITNNNKSAHQDREKNSKNLLTRQGFSAILVSFQNSGV